MCVSKWSILHILFKSITCSKTFSLTSDWTIISQNYFYPVINFYFNIHRCLLLKHCDTNCCWHKILFFLYNNSFSLIYNSGKYMIELQFPLFRIFLEILCFDWLICLVILPLLKISTLVPLWYISYCIIPIFFTKILKVPQEKS